MLKDLGITESRMVTMITSLANAEDKTGLLTNSINTANAAWRENTALVAIRHHRESAPANGELFFQSEDSHRR